MDELSALVRELGMSLKARVEVVEAAQDRTEQAQRDHKVEVDNRLAVYEATQERVAERVVKSVERLARLEVIPERMEKLERLVAGQSRWMQREIKALNERINGVEMEIRQNDAEKQGQMRAGVFALETFKFIIEYGWKIALIVGGGLMALVAFDDNPRDAARVTIQQPPEVQGLPQGRGGQDMPLRLE